MRFFQRSAVVIVDDGRRRPGRSDRMATVSPIWWGSSPSWFSTSSHTSATSSKSIASPSRIVWPFSIL